MKARIRNLIDQLFAPLVTVMRNYRWSRYLYQRGWPFVAQHLRFRQLRYGCHISEKAQIDPSLHLVHCSGIVIGEGVIIKENVKIWQNVTIGSHGRVGEPLAYPVIEAGVRIYAGAVIIGNVTVGENAIVGANCVVLDDVPAGTTAVGVPYKNPGLRRHEAEAS